MVWGAAVISIDLYILKGHRPSDRADELVDFYLAIADGIVVNRTHIISTAHLMDVLRRRKIADLPALDVPSVYGRKAREMVVGLEAIEKWCKENA
jgi:hypothetical protein